MMTIQKTLSPEYLYITTTKLMSRRHSEDNSPGVGGGS